MFLTRENDIFAFQNIAMTTRETRRKEILTDSVNDSPTTLYNKHQTEHHLIVDCGLRTADCGLRTMDSGPHLREKNSSAHIVILKRFLKFAIAKMEMSNSSSLPLTPPCCEAWPPRLGNRGKSPLKVTGMFVAFLKGRNCTFWVFNIFDHRGMAYGCA